ncbi:hypothetical protein GH714_022807 [Hevea brasiliensis]|uniref:Heparan-alpha-glucosaminide N-acetyltransferase catalytic domain-containing protein n=1 Tax=Hevea brasiliensis TaxID=3981 RepID=A0A6A6NIN5_HEVBR|nr:hypothetical protein GH714_022807 [Hevea brasiliensis]
MATLITVTEDEQRQPLLLHSTSPNNGQEQETTPSSSSNDVEETPPPPPPNQRLISLDVFRGLTVARISIGYLFASMSEIWLVDHIMVDSPLDFVKKYYVQWMFSLLLCSLYLCLLYGLYIPNWEFEAPRMNLFGYGSGTQIVNSPDYGPLPPNSPAWCLAPFDPEGILSLSGMSLTSISDKLKSFLVSIDIVGILGPQAEGVFVVDIFFSLLITGYVLKLLGIPFSKPLYTLSYMCITAGASGLLLTIIFYVVDVKHFKKPMVIFQWMGMNALIIYALAACELFPAALQGFYWHSPENNLLQIPLPYPDVISEKIYAHFDYLAFYMLYTKSKIGTCCVSHIISVLPLRTPSCHRGSKREMATETANDQVLHTHNDSNQQNSTESSANSKGFAKALAHRALYSSSSSRPGSRKVRNNDVKTLPSRLNKVSLADVAEN